MSLGFRVGQSDFFYYLLVFRKAGASHREREKERERETKAENRITKDTQRERAGYSSRLLTLFSRERSFAICPCALSRR